MKIHTAINDTSSWVEMDKVNNIYTNFISTNKEVKLNLDVPDGKIKTKILWHVDPLLGNDRKVSKYTTAVTE